MTCPHGINLKHKRCDSCEEVARGEGWKDMKTEKTQEFDFHEIDLHNLHEEWASQVRMYRHYAELLAGARRDHEHAKTDREVAEKDLKLAGAEVDLEIRRAGPEKFGLEKFTEPSIENLVRINKKYKTAQDEAFRFQRVTIDLGHKVGMLEAAVKTLDNRKKALEDAVQLRLSDYFSEPRKPRAVQDSEAKSAFNKKKNKAEHPFYGA